MTPMPADKFFKEGKPPQKVSIQNEIMLLLEENPDVAFSSKELVEHLEARPQAINQALRSLADKGKIIRGMIQENRRYVTYAKLRKPGDEKYAQKFMANTEENGQ